MYIYIYIYPAALGPWAVQSYEKVPSNPSPGGVSPPKNLPLDSPNPYSVSGEYHNAPINPVPKKHPQKNTGNLNKGWQGDSKWSHKWAQNLQFEGGAAKMKTVLPCTREHNFQGFGGSRFGPFRHPFPNLCQRPLQTPQNTKNYKNQSPKWYPLSWPRCPGITLWGPWIPMVVSK